MASFFPAARSATLHRVLSTASRLAGWPRRIAALLLLAAAAVYAVQSPGRSAPPAVATRQVLVAAHDLRAGAVVTVGDLRAVRLPASTVPSGALHPGAALDHRTLAGPVRRGETLTDVRFTGSALTAALAGPQLLAVPVRLADAGTAALLRPGDRVDLVAGAEHGGAGPPVLLARDVPVLLVPPARADSTVDGALVVLGAPENTARRIAGVATSVPLTVTLRATR